MPSFDEVRNFKLPKYTITEKVSFEFHSTSLYIYVYIYITCIPQFENANGVPFYVNSIISILRMCLANPITASLLHRFPEVPSSSLKYGYLLLNLYTV